MNKTWTNANRNLVAITPHATISRDRSPAFVRLVTPVHTISSIRLHHRHFQLSNFLLKVRRVTRKWKPVYRFRAGIKECVKMTTKRPATPVSAGQGSVDAIASSISVSIVFFFPLLITHSLLFFNPQMIAIRIRVSTELPAEI